MSGEKNHSESSYCVHTCATLFHVRSQLDIVQGVCLRVEVEDQVHDVFLAPLVVCELHVLFLHAVDEVAQHV